MVDVVDISQAPINNFKTRTSGLVYHGTSVYCPKEIGHGVECTGMEKVKERHVCPEQSNGRHVALRFSLDLYILRRR